MKTLRRFKYWKDRLDSPHPVIWFSTILSNLMHTKIDELIELAHSHGVVGVNFIPLLHYTPASKAFIMNDFQVKDFQAALPKLVELAEGHGISTNLRHLFDENLIKNTLQSDIPILLDVKDSTDQQKSFAPKQLVGTPSESLAQSPSPVPWAKVPCYRPWTYLVIHSTGHVQPCINESAHSYIGDRSLREVWYEDEHLNNLRKMMSNQTLHKMCSGCCAPLIGRNREIRQQLLTVPSMGGRA